MYDLLDAVIINAVFFLGVNSEEVLLPKITLWGGLLHSRKIQHVFSWCIATNK